MKRIGSLCLLWVGCVALVSPVWAEPGAQQNAVVSVAGLQRQASVEGINEYILPNGLVVLLAPDDSKPTTTVNVTYKVGSRMENYGETGMAHLLEHLMFKGSPNFPGRTIVQEFAKRGMQFNGSTFYDRTNYHETFSANPENLDWALRMEADRMVNSYIARSDLDSEMTVVRNEMESGENNPEGMLWQKMMAAAFQWHSYGKSTIGARSDVENVGIPNLQAFYHKYYQPDNAVLVVAGKFDPEATLKAIQRYFGVIPKPERVLPTFYTREPVQEGAREVRLQRVGDNQIVGALYHIPASAHPDTAALELLSFILSDAPSGRLYKALVEKKLATSADVDVLNLHDPGALIAFVETGKKQSVELLQRGLLAQLEDLRQHPITEAELQRAKLAYRNQYEKILSDPAHFGVALSESIAEGDWRLFFIQRDRIDAASVKDVQRVAEQYLVPSNRTLGVFTPADKVQRATIPDAPDISKLVAGYTGRDAVNEGEAFDPSPANIEARTSRSVLGNGMQLALLPKLTRAHVVKGHLVLRMGDENSLKGKTHLSEFTAAMLMRGTRKLDRQQIADRLDALHAQLNISGHNGVVDVSFETRRDQLPDLLVLMRDVLRTPSFPRKEFEEIRSQSIAGIEEQQKQPETLVERALSRYDNPYPKGDVHYAETVEEEIAAIQALRWNDLKPFHAEFYGAEHAQMALVGDFDAKATASQIASLFGDWKAHQPYARIATPYRQSPPTEIQLEAPDKANAFFMSALSLPVRDDTPEAPALTIANRILGGGSLKSRLAERLRQKEGLSYGVGSALRIGSQDPSANLSLYAIYAPQNLARLKQGLREELDRFVRDGVTEQELEEARSGLLQSAQIARSQDSSLAHSLTGQLYLHRDMNYVIGQEAKLKAVTVEEVNAAIRKYIDPAKLVMVFAGDFAKATATAAVPAK